MEVKRLLIDTNIYAFAFRGDVSISEILQQADTICLSAISIGELLYGFKKGNREAQNIHILNKFLDSPRVSICPVDQETAAFYAEIQKNLRAIGKPIPTNDIWIAACAFQHGLKMFTADVHFTSIPGLSTLYKKGGSA